MTSYKSLITITDISPIYHHYKYITNISPLPIYLKMKTRKTTFSQKTLVLEARWEPDGFLDLGGNARLKKILFVKFIFQINTLQWCHFYKGEKPSTYAWNTGLLQRGSNKSELLPPTPQDPVWVHSMMILMVAIRKERKRRVVEAEVDRALGRRSRNKENRWRWSLIQNSSFKIFTGF